MYQRLEEIQKEIKEYEQSIVKLRLLIDSLSSEASSIIASVIAAEVSNLIELYFETDRRTITWNGGSLKLGHKSWLFIKTLWEGGRHVASVEKIEKVVWGGKVRKKRLVKVGNRTIKADTIPRNTLNSFLLRLRVHLRGVFPYKIISVKSRETREIAAYRLKRTRLRNKIFENEQ
jgi:hypothetical protein